MPPLRPKPSRTTLPSTLIGRLALAVFAAALAATASSAGDAWPFDLGSPKPSLGATMGVLPAAPPRAGDPVTIAREARRMSDLEFYFEHIRPIFGDVVDMWAPRPDQVVVLRHAFRSMARGGALAGLFVLDRAQFVRQAICSIGVGKVPVPREFAIDLGAIGGEYLTVPLAPLAVDERSIFVPIAFDQVDPPLATSVTSIIAGSSALAAPRVPRPHSTASAFDRVFEASAVAFALLIVLVPAGCAAIAAHVGRVTRRSQSGDHKGMLDGLASGFANAPPF